MADVTAHYLLRDDMSGPADRIQKKLLALEATLHSIDKHNTNLGKNRGFEEYAGRSGASSDKVNKKLGDLNKTYGDLTKNLEKSTKSLDKQRDSMDSHARTSTAMRAGLDGIRKQEDALAQSMAEKNKHLKTQISGMKEHEKAATRSDRAMQKFNDTQRQLPKLLDDILKKQKEIDKGHNYFADGMAAGAQQYELLKKITSMLPAVGVGWAGIGGIIAGVTTGVGGLAGSVGKLAGALGVIPGLFAAVGVAAGTAFALNQTIFQPILKSKSSLTSINSQIANAQRSLSQARSRNAASTTPAGSVSSGNSVVNAEARLAQVEQQRAVIMQKIAPLADKFQQSIDATTAAWRTAWWGKDGKRAEEVINAADKGLTALQAILVKADPLFQKGADFFVYVVNAAEKLSKNPVFMSGIFKGVDQSFENAKKMVDIGTNLAPVFSGIFQASTEVTGELLDQVGLWSQQYTHAQNVERVVKKIKGWMDSGVSSLKTWLGTLKNFGSGLVDLVAPMAGSFDRQLRKMSVSFKKWAEHITGKNLGDAKNGKPLQGPVDPNAPSKFKDFQANGMRELGALGNILLAIAKAIGKIGSDKKASDATVHFLNSIAHGIGSFTNFSIKAMKELGPALNNFFAAFGKAHKGSGDVAISFMSLVVRGMTDFVKTVDKFTPNKFLGAMAGIMLTITTLGALTGVLLSATALPRKLLGKGLARTGVGKALGKTRLGKMLPGVAGDLEKKGMAVWVTNWPGGGNPLDTGGGGGGGGKPSAPGEHAPGTFGEYKAPKGPRTIGMVIKDTWSSTKALIAAAATTFISSTVAVVLGSAAVAAIISAVAGWYVGKTINKISDKVVNHLNSGHDSQQQHVQSVAIQHPGSKAANNSAVDMYKKYAGGDVDLLGRTYHNANSPVGDNALTGAVASVQKSTTAIARSLGIVPKAVKKSYDDGSKATSAGGKKLAAATDRAGQAAWAPLAAWQKRVNAIMTQMGVPSSALSGSSTDSKTGQTVTAASGSSSSFYAPATGDSYYGSGSRTGDSKHGSGRKSGAGAKGSSTTYDGHPGNINSGLIPYIDKAHTAGLTVTATTDHSKYTTSGNISNHWLGKAVDFSNGSSPTPQMDAFYASLVPYAKSGALSELIYKHNGWSGGKKYNYTGSDHFNHVHVAIGSGAGPAAGGGAVALPGLPGFPNTVMGQATANLAKNAYSYLNAKLGNSGGGAEAGSSSASSGAIADMIKTAAGDYGANYKGLLAVAKAESGLNPNAWNKTDSNAKAGTPSKGIFQFIEPTFNSMSAQAKKADPSAWAGVNDTWLDPMAQALTAAWAFTHGKSGQWATASHYATGDGMGVPTGSSLGGSNRPRLTSVSSPSRRSSGGGSTQRRGGGGGHTFNTTVVLQGAIVLNDEGKELIGNIAGEHVAKHVIRAQAGAVTNKDI